MQADLLADALRQMEIFFFLPLFQVFSDFGIYSVVLWSGFNVGSLSSITDSAKPEDICLVIAVFSVNS